MKHIHFFKGFCGIGIHNLPHKQTEHIDGVEIGPDAVLSAQYLQTHFPTARIHDFHFPHPTTFNRESYLGTITHQYKLFAQMIAEQIKPDETQVVIGGDHTVGLSSLIGLLSQIHPENVGYIQFDSHGDINTVASSPSGNFHGMWLRAVIDVFDNTDINDIAPNKLPTANILFIGDMDLDPGERNFIKEHAIPVIGPLDLQSNQKKTIKTVESFMQKFSHLHVSFDVDVFDSSIVSATGTPHPSGIFPEHIMPILKVLSGHPSLSVDLVEVNPTKKGSDQTIKLAQQVLLTILH